MTAITADITNKSTAAIVTMVKNQIKRGKIVYPAYVSEHGVTRATVPAHVKALVTAAYPGVVGSCRAELGTPERDAKQFADKVRIGLQSYLPVDETSDDDNAPVNYLTADGLAALKAADVSDADMMVLNSATDILRTLFAEIERRNK